MLCMIFTRMPLNLQKVNLLKVNLLKVNLQKVNQDTFRALLTFMSVGHLVQRHSVELDGPRVLAEFEVDVPHVHPQTTLKTSMDISLHG